MLRLFKEIKGPEEQKRVAKTFRGQTVRLATHAIGARVVQTALDSLPVASAALIKVGAVKNRAEGKVGWGPGAVCCCCCYQSFPGRKRKGS